MGIVQTEKKDGVVVTKTLENGQANGSYSEDWGDFRIVGQTKDGKLDGIFYRYNTDIYHRDSPIYDSMQIYKDGKLNAEYILNPLGARHGSFWVQMDNGDRVEGTCANGLKVEETVYRGNSRIPKKHTEYKETGKVITSFTTKGVPESRTTINDDKSKIVEKLDANGNVISTITYDADGVLKSVVNNPPSSKNKNPKRTTVKYDKEWDMLLTQNNENNKTLAKDSPSKNTPQTLFNLKGFLSRHSVDVARTVMSHESNKSPPS